MATVTPRDRRVTRSAALATADHGLVPSRRARLPQGLTVLERPPQSGWGRADGPVVVLVHGSLDHARSFARVVRRLPELGVVAYDRRGYRGSRSAAPAGSIRSHVDDLLAVAAAYGDVPGVASPSSRVVAVGHSLGGSIVIGAAIETPKRFGAIGAYEPPLPWFGFARPGARPIAPDADPAAAVERFFSQMGTGTAWARMGARHRSDREAYGPALLTDLRSLSGPAPFDIAALRVRGVVAAGGPASTPHHRAGADWLATRVAGMRRMELADAAHGAHLTHPDAFAGLVRGVVSLVRRAEADVR